MNLIQKSVVSLVVAANCLLCVALRAEPVADFSITDVNTTSPRFGTMVSPRDYRHQVSGYYFGDPG